MKRIDRLTAAVIIAAWVASARAEDGAQKPVTQLDMVIGSDQRLLIPASFLGGAIFLVWADAAARTLLAPTEIPVGVLTALCGGPFFVFLLRRQEEGRGL